MHAPCSAARAACDKFMDLLRHSCGRAPIRHRSTHRRRTDARRGSPPRHCATFRPPARINSRSRASRAAVLPSRPSSPLPLRAPSNSSRRGGRRTAAPLRAAPAGARGVAAGAAARRSARSVCSTSGSKLAHDLIDQRLRGMQCHRDQRAAAARRRRQLRARSRGSQLRVPRAQTRNRRHRTRAASAALTASALGHAADLDPHGATTRLSACAPAPAHAPSVASSRAASA